MHIIFYGLDLKVEENIKAKQSQANSKFIDDYRIVYSRDLNTAADIEKMKQGYLAMRDLNLELSEYGFESCMKDLIEYEASL